MFLFYMAIEPKCDRCKKELIEYGAILFGPPDMEGKAKKFHICKECYEKIILEFKN